MTFFYWFATLVWLAVVIWYGVLRYQLRLERWEAEHEPWADETVEWLRSMACESSKTV